MRARPKVRASTVVGMDRATGLFSRPAGYRIELVRYSRELLVKIVENRVSTKPILARACRV